MISSMVRNVGIMAPIATGGVITSDGAYTIHTFISDGTFTIIDQKLADVLVVGGGGAGRRNVSYPGGGGGGSVYHREGMILVPGDYDITIGQGGDPATDDVGQPTDAFYVHAIGGGSDSDPGANGVGANGYAEGDSTTGSIVPWVNWDSYGNNTGGNIGWTWAGGGGAGAGGNGGSSHSGSYAGNGGGGKAIAISGTNVSYAGGGGGGGGAVGSGSSGGGNGDGSPGAPNRGGGGGAGGGIGGSGVVIVRYVR